MILRNCQFKVIFVFSEILPQLKSYFPNSLCLTMFLGKHICFLVEIMEANI